MSRNLLQIVLRHADGLSPADAPDAHLLRRFAATRDEQAFAALVKRHAPMVWAVCRQSIPNRADAEDAFQAVFLALAQSAKKVRTPEHLGGWLHGAAVRICGRAKRTFVRRQTRERGAAKRETDSPVSAAAWNDLLAAVHAEVADLPKSLRAAFVLCDLQGVEQDAAAKQLGLKTSTLTGQLARARQRLMAALAKRGIAAGAVAVGVAVAAPEALANSVTGGAVPSAAVVELAREVTTMGVSKLKLLAAGLLVAGGLAFTGFGLVQRAEGQTPVKPGTPPGFGGGAGGPGATPLEPPPGVGGGVPGGLPPGPGGGLEGPGPGTGGGPLRGDSGFGPPAAPKGPEYLFAAKPGTVADVAKLIRSKGDKGWEYTGPLDVDPADPPKGNEFEGITKDTRVVLVFKKRPALSGMGGGMSGGMGSLGGGGNFNPLGGGGIGPGGPPSGGGDVKPGGSSGGPPSGGGGSTLPPGSTGGSRFGGGPPGGGSNPFGGGGGDGGRPAKAESKPMVVALRNVSAAELSATISEVYSKVDGVRVVPDPKTNSLILLAPNDQTLMQMQELIAVLDKDVVKPPKLTK